MKIIKYIFGFVLIMLASAFIAPLLAKFIPYEFDRILSRTVMVLFLVVAGVLLIRNKGIDVKYYGLTWDGEAWKRLSVAFVLGVVTLSLMSAFEMIFGVRVWQFTLYQTVWPLKILKYLFSALFIGLLEEFIFRGVLYRNLEKSTRIVSALIVTNIIYSLVHFLRYSGGVDMVNPTFVTSLQVYAAILEPFTKLDQIWPGAIGLFLFGLVLSYAYLKTGRNLAFPIGLHAGLVFFIKADRWFIHIENETHKIWFGGTDLHACILGWIFISLVAVWIWFVYRVPCKR